MPARPPPHPAHESTEASPEKGEKADLHFDTSADFKGMTRKEMLSRAGAFFGWCLFYLAATALIGLLPAMLLFLIGYIRFVGREPWKTTLSVTLPPWILSYVLFHHFLRVVWPQSLLGDLLPVIRSIRLLNIL